MEKPLINKKYLLEKFEVKGSWTFARILEIDRDKTNPFGWKKVRGFIDGYEIRKFHLMPMGDGTLFLPINAQIRRGSKKKPVIMEVVLYPDNEPLEVPEEMAVCLQDEPKAYTFFKKISKSEQSFISSGYILPKKKKPRLLV